MGVLKWVWVGRQTIVLSHAEMSSGPLVGAVGPWKESTGWRLSKGFFGKALHQEPRRIPATFPFGRYLIPSPLNSQPPWGGVCPEG